MLGEVRFVTHREKRTSMKDTIKQTNMKIEKNTDGSSQVTVENDLVLYEDLANVLLKHQKRVPVASAISTMLMALAVVADHDPQCEVFIVDAYRYYCEVVNKDEDHQGRF